MKRRYIYTFDVEIDETEDETEDFSPSAAIEEEIDAADGLTLIALDWTEGEVPA
jgi:hypothetical protein